MGVKSLDLTDITKTQITESSIVLSYVHGIYYEVCMCMCSSSVCTALQTPGWHQGLRSRHTHDLPRACLPQQMPSKAAVLAHVDKGAARPPRKARALLVLGTAKPPTVREVLVTLTRGSDGKPVASNLESTNIHSSKLPALPYNQRPHGVMDQVG